MKMSRTSRPASCRYGVRQSRAPVPQVIFAGIGSRSRGAPNLMTGFFLGKQSYSWLVRFHDLFRELPSAEKGNYLMLFRGGSEDRRAIFGCIRGCAWDVTLLSLTCRSFMQRESAPLQYRDV